MKEMNDETLRSLFNESGRRALEEVPDKWFTRRVMARLPRRSSMARLPRRSSMARRVAWGVFIVMCMVAVAVYADYARVCLHAQDYTSLVVAAFCVLASACGLGLQLNRLLHIWR